MYLLRLRLMICVSHNRLDSLDLCQCRMTLYAISSLCGHRNVLQSTGKVLLLALVSSSVRLLHYEIVLLTRLVNIEGRLDAVSLLYQYG